MKKAILGRVWQFEWMEYCAYFLVFLIPVFVATNHVFPYSSPKMFLLLIGVLVMLILYSWGRIVEQKSEFRFGIIDLLLIVYVAVLSVSGLFGVNPKLSFFGDFSGLPGIVFIGGQVLFAGFIAFLVRRNESFIIKLLTSSVITSAITIIFLYANPSFLKDSSYGSTLGNNSYLGAYLLMNLFFTIALFFISKKINQRIFFGIITLFLVSSPILFNHDLFRGTKTFTEALSNPILFIGVANGAVFGIACALLVSVSIMLLRSSNKIISWSGVALFLSFIISLYIGARVFMNPESKLHRVYVEEKNANRFVFWDIAAIASYERPFLGWGPNGYNYAFQEHFNPIFFTKGYAIETWTYNPHNMFWEYRVNTGIIGLGVYLILIGASCIIFLKVSRKEEKIKRVISITLLGAISGYVIQNLFVFDTAAPLLMFFVAIGCASGFEKTKLFFIEKKTVKDVCMSLLIILSLLAIIFWGIRPWRESRAWGRYTSLDEIVRLGLPQDMSPVGYGGDTALLADKVYDFIQSNSDSKNISDKEKQLQKEIFQKMIIEIEKDITNDVHPHTRSYWALGKIKMLYAKFQTGEDRLDTIASARKDFERAISINKNNPDIYHEIVQTYANERNFSLMRQWLRVSIIVAPQYKDSYIIADRIINLKLGTPSFDLYIEEMKNRWMSQK